MEDDRATQPQPTPPSSPPTDPPATAEATPRTSDAPAAPAAPAGAPAATGAPSATTPTAGAPVAAGAPSATVSADDLPSEPVRLGRREGRSPRDMVISLLVLLIPIALLLTFYRVVLSGDAPVTVDPRDTIQQAQAAAVFPVAVPGPLGDDWHTISATWLTSADGATLRIGYVAPDDDSIQLIESNIPPEKLLPAELTDQAKPRGTVRAGQAAWRSYLARPGESALVLNDQTRTIIVIGNADPEHLKTLASSLALG